MSVVTARPGEPLSRREIQVLSFAAHGHNRKEAASRMGLSIWTVADYHRRAMVKLEARNMVHAVALWLRGAG